MPISIQPNLWHQIIVRRCISKWAHYLSNFPNVDTAASFINDFLSSSAAAQILNDTRFSLDSAARILNNNNLLIEKAAAIVGNENLEINRLAHIFNNSALVIDKLAAIVDSPDITSARIKEVLDSGILSDADRIAALLDADSLTAADGAAHVNSGVYPDDLMAAAFNSSYLAATKAASISDDSNLTEAKLQSILDNTNLTIQKGQEIVDAMTDPTKIGRGGRRGIIGDDWDDNKLTSRDNAAVVPTALDKIFQAFRPEWTVVQGSVIVANGRIEGDASGGGNRIQTPLSITEGTWKVDIIILATRTNQLILFIYQDDANFWWAGNNAGEWCLMKYQGGAATYLIESTWSEATGTYTFKVTRDSSGNFEIFVNGVSKGTATDSFLPTQNYLQLKVDGDNASAMDNLEVS